MSEQEWLDCLDPKPRMNFVADNASERQLRLFALAACVSGWQGVGKRHRLMYAATEAGGSPAGRPEPGKHTKDDAWVAWWLRHALLAHPS
jgi:hypothetical protein